MIHKAFILGYLHKKANDAESSPSYSFATSGDNNPSSPKTAVPKAGTPAKLPSTTLPANDKTQQVDQATATGPTNMDTGPGHKSHALKMLRTSLATQQNTFPTGHPLESLNVLAQNNANAVNSQAQYYPSDGLAPEHSAAKAMDNSRTLQETLSQSLTPGITEEMGKVPNGDYIVELLNESTTMNPEDGERYLETKLGNVDRKIDNL
jgi:hypothetical protein